MHGSLLSLSGGLVPVIRDALIQDGYYQRCASHTLTTTRHPPPLTIHPHLPSITTQSRPRFQHVVRREYTRVFGGALHGEHVPYGLPTAQIPTAPLGPDFTACT